MPRGDFTDKSIEKSTAALDTGLRINESFDIVRRDIIVCEKTCAVYFTDGLVKDETMQKVLDTFIKLKDFTPSDFSDIKRFCDTYVSYAEIELINDYDKAVTAVLSGVAVMLVDGVCGAVGIDCRTYPVRSVQEPENDKVLRGARVGFVETMVFNTALIRRHIRTRSLTMSYLQVGEASKTDIVICYIDGVADMKYVGKLKKLISEISVSSLTLGAESLAECLIKTRWYNPFPKIRYTERPDCCAAHLLEGKVAVITDNSPSVMILPTSIFDFTQETDDYYLPPLTGTYLRTIRGMVFFLTLFLSPLWYLLIMYPQLIPPWLDFIKVAENPGLPIIIQLFLLEFAVDGLKLAALNTPDVLSGSFSIIGGLILGDFAVKVGWFIPETILYMAFVAIANFTQPSYELGYAFKFTRLLLLLFTSLFGIWGFGFGIIIFTVLIACNKTVCGGHYLYPLIPLNVKVLGGMIVRRRL